MDTQCFNLLTIYHSKNCDPIIIVSLKGYRTVTQWRCEGCETPAR